MDSVEDFVKSGQNNECCQPDESFANAVRERFWDGRNLEGEEKVMSDFIMNANFCMYEGADPEYLSAKFLGQESFFKGEEHVFPNGYNQIVDVLAKGLEIDLS